jgi:hypothetical protein
VRRGGGSNEKVGAVERIHLAVLVLTLVIVPVALLVLL